jgi:hypothetical protein
VRVFEGRPAPLVIMCRSGAAIEAWFTPLHKLRLIVAIKLASVDPSMMEVRSRIE